MKLLRYLHEQEQYSISFKTVNQHIVQITGDFPIKTSGFTLSREGKEDDWDYSGYRTVYRKIDGGAQFSNNGSVYIPPEPIPEPEPYVPTLEEVQEAKVAEMEAIKQAVTDAGIDVMLEDGTVEHFTLTSDDMIYLLGLRSDVEDGKEELPWSTSDVFEHCKNYSNVNMKKIMSAAKDFAAWNKTYLKDLSIYIRSLDSREDVEAVTYGMEIPEKYRSEPLKKMMAAQSV